MAYIGQSPITGLFKKQSLTTDGSTTSFDLDFTVASTTSIIVSVGGVLQEPETAYTLGGGGTSITFPWYVIVPRGYQGNVIVPPVSPKSVIGNVIEP